MCGIWGFITGEKATGTTGRTRFVEAAAMAGTVRGDDSTGAFIVRNGKPQLPDWCKVQGTGYEWVRHKLTQERFVYDKARYYRAVVGHNRSATTGAVTLDNAHPFQEGPITLVHNGTLDSLYGLKVQADEVGTRGKPVEVDSHLICHNLAVHPVAEVLPTLRGAFALVWHDERDDTIYMVRNDERPLHFMRAKCEDTVLFASEADMLWWLAGRCNFSRDGIVSLDSGVLLAFRPDSTVPEATKVTLTPRYQYAAGNYSGWRAGGTATSPGKPEAADREDVPQTGFAMTKRGKALLEKAGINWRRPLDFSVESIIPTQGETCTVNGWAYLTGPDGKTEAIQALIHGLNRKFAKDSEEKDWYVRPVTTYQIGERGKEHTALICRLLRVSGGRSTPSSVTRVVGPTGSMITTEAWLAATRKGCYLCHGSLDPRFAASMTWLSPTKPMCVDCSEAQMLGGIYD